MGVDAALNVNGMLWRTCPSATELEMVVCCDWLRGALGLPEGLFGFLNDTASSSALWWPWRPQGRAPTWTSGEQGMAGRPDLPPLVVYASDQAHSSIAKACLTLGLGLDGFHSGWGTTRATSMDVRRPAESHRPGPGGPSARGPLGSGGDRRHHLHHLCRPGARDRRRVRPRKPLAPRGRGLRRLGGEWAPELRWCLDGCDRADSFVFNPHKWMFTPIDASALFTRHPDTFRRAFSLVPEYLTTPVTGQVVDLMDYGVQLGRRFRALKLWWILRGPSESEGIRERIRQACTGWPPTSPPGWRASRTSSCFGPYPVLGDLLPRPAGRPDGGDELDAFNLQAVGARSTPRERSSCPTRDWTTGSPCGSPSAIWVPPLPTYRG